MKDTAPGTRRLRTADLARLRCNTADFTRGQEGQTSNTFELEVELKSFSFCGRRGTLEPQG